MDEDKKEPLVRLEGEGNQNTMREWFGYKERNCKNIARYLGPLMTWNGSRTVEIDNLIRATEAAHAAYHGLWYRRLDLQLKAIDSQAIVEGTFLSVLIIYSFVTAEYEKLSKCIFTFLRL